MNPTLYTQQHKEYNTLYVEKVGYLSVKSHHNKATVVKASENPSLFIVYVKIW